jgi:Flp pilus assembly protein TadG
MRRVKPTKATNDVRSTDDGERGAATIVVAIMMVALLGMAALAVDVGAMYAEKAQVQNAADAGALAIAGDCAGGACGDTDATAAQLADSNSNDAASGVTSVTFPAATTVRVETFARAAGSDADSFSLYFARLMGFDTTEIHAVAEASWGPPDSGSTLPWTVSECVFRDFLTSSQRAELDSTGNFTGDPIATHILLRYDENTPDYEGCVAQNGYEPGGFGWLEANADCSADITADGIVNGQPGNSFPKVGGSDNVCQDVLKGLLGEPVLIPLFSSAINGGGSKTQYTLIGFAAFQVTGYKFGGGPGLTHNDTSAPSCTGMCRGLQGFFTRFVTLDEGRIATGDAPNFGASKVELTG